MHQKNMLLSTASQSGGLLLEPQYQRNPVYNVQLVVPTQRQPGLCGKSVMSDARMQGNATCFEAILLLSQAYPPCKRPKYLYMQPYITGKDVKDHGVESALCMQKRAAKESRTTDADLLNKNNIQININDKKIYIKKCAKLTPKCR